MQYLTRYENKEIQDMTPDEIKDKIEITKKTLNGITGEAAKVQKHLTKLEKSLFDTVVRKVIDSGLVYMKCNHRNIVKNSDDTSINGTWFIGESPRVRYNGTGMLEESGIFYGVCRQCQAGVNKHDCSIEGESYYFTCAEARVVNNVARQYGIVGSIHTAT